MCHAEHSASAWHIGKLIHCHIDKSADNLLYLFIGFVEFVPAKLNQLLRFFQLFAQTVYIQFITVYT